MRIAYVTAHYPPDFTSGATLQVERLARGVAELGHCVEVFSGAIDRDLADGATSTVHPQAATGADSVTVHWIGTETRIAQDDDRNWRNPAAGAAVADWLEAFRPDVIHMHTLQTLGVEVVEAALASGARTIVTMHDMWWWCARLFLVDTQLQPCPLVTDVATCACARGADWRGERALRLRHVLDRVDEILVPSATLRDVVIANGIHPDRVAVDENDIAAFIPSGPEPAGPADLDPNDRATAVSSGTQEAAVRFLYVGGDSELKGADVLRRAIGELAGITGWTLDAYGLQPWPGQPAACRTRAPYEPAEIGAILGRHDVLVIPSLARESFSLAAREALAAGLAVITSDCLGPEEVVVDDRNGLVTPTGDAASLAEAMRRLVDDRALLDRLRADARATPVTVRSTSDHAVALVERYATADDQRIPADAAGPADDRVASPSHPRSVLFVVGADGAMARYRVHHPAEALALHGVGVEVTHYLDPDLGDRGRAADVVVLQRVPATVALLQWIEQWRVAGVLVVFEVDDLVVDPALIDEIPTLAARSADDQALYLDGLRRYRTTLEACDGAIVATPAIADHVTTLTELPAAVVPNGLGLVELRLAERARHRSTPRGRRPVRLAYLAGSDSHQPDLDLIAGPLADSLRRHPDAELLIVGDVDPGRELSALGRRVRHEPFQPWQRLPELLTTIDVNLAPLVLPSRFNEAKSAIKWLEAAASAVPTIASPSPPFVDAVQDGRTGILAATPDAWVEAIEVLVADPARRRRIGAAARRAAELHHGPHVTAVSYFGALTTLADERRPLASTATSSWGPVAPDERAASAPVLQPYDITLHATRRSPFARLRRLVRRVVDT